MSYNSAVITQEDLEPTVLPNPNLTMALPSLATVLDPQIPKKKLLQMTMLGRVATPTPETRCIQVKGHNRSSKEVKSHTRKIRAKPHGNKKEAKTIKSKKKKGGPRLTAFPKLPDDCKESVELAKTLHIQELRDLVHKFK
jgi:hypothetical protein